MPIYTKKGDKGETGLPGQRRLSKTDQLFEVLGSFDQTSATIGLAVSFVGKEGDDVVKLLRAVQSDLLGIGAFLAAEKHRQDAVLKILPGRIRLFEKTIDRWEEETGALTNFILAGGSNAGSALHLARTISRKSEREYHRLANDSKNAVISRYLNRLSDFLFQAARVINYRQNNIEQNWKSPQSSGKNP